MSTPDYVDPMLSFERLKKIRMGDKILHDYQQKLLELRDKYLSQTESDEHIFFYEDKCDNTNIITNVTPEQVKPPLDNIFAYFIFFPVRLMSASNDWYLYWNPNLECEDNMNLIWDFSRFNELPPSRAKTIATLIKTDLIKAGFGKYFKNNRTIDRSFANDDVEYDPYTSDHSYDSDENDFDTHAKLHFKNSPDTESYMPDYTSYGLND